MEIPQNTGRVTAGLPAVDPSKRFARDYRELHRSKQNAALADAETKRAAAVAPDGSRDVTDPEQAGVWLSGYELMRRLNALNPSLLFIPSTAVPGVVMICVQDRDRESGLRFICGMEQEKSPEFEIPEYYEEERANGLGGYETVKVCTGTKRGWRTVLKILMRDGFIHQGGAEKMFGAPSKGSQRWQLAIS